METRLLPSVGAYGSASHNLFELFLRYQLKKAATALKETGVGIYREPAAPSCPGFIFHFPAGNDGLAVAQ